MLLSRILKFCCIAGVVVFPLLILLYWFLDMSQFRLPSNWYIQFSDTPTIEVQGLSFRLRMIGFGLDLIPCFFFVGVLVILSKLFKKFELLHFFSKMNIRHMKWIAFFLSCKLVIYPFYLILRNSIFIPVHQKHSLIYIGSNEFKSLIIILSALLIAYIMEVLLYLEEDLIGTI